MNHSPGIDSITALVWVVLICARCLPPHLHPLGCADEFQIEVERASPSWTGSLVSTVHDSGNTRTQTANRYHLVATNSASAATIVKLVIIVRLQTAKGAAASALHYELLLWADIELGIALFAAASAALRPLLKSVPSVWDSHLFTPRTKMTKYFSKPSTRGTRHTASSASHPQGTGPYVEVGVGGTSGEDLEMNRLDTKGRGSLLEGSILKTTTVAVHAESDESRVSQRV